jgi:hypothetical protein
MTSRKPAPAAISLALALLERLAVCRDQLKMAADQLRESCDDDGRFARRAGNGRFPRAVAQELSDHGRLASLTASGLAAPNFP